MRFITILLCILFSWAMARGEQLSVGFMIYGDPVPEEALYAFDWLVLDPDSSHTRKVMNMFYLKNRRAKLIAYVSVGEAEPYREYFKEVKSECILGENKVWNSMVLDLRKEECLDFLLRRVFPRLKDFDGFFLDTLDSHQLFLKEPQDLKKVQENLIKLVRTVRQTYPGKLILLNRGFEIMEALVGQADAIVAESLFRGISYDRKKQYKAMKPEETQWLLERLKKAQQLGYRVIVIDYVEPKDKKLQAETVKKIMDLGFIPYVSDRYLRIAGVSQYRLVPRRILMLYYKKLYADPSYTQLNRLIQPWLEYLGYVPVIMDIDKALEDDRLAYFMADIYAGIVVEPGGYKSNKFHKWLLKKKEEGLKIFFLNSFGFEEDNAHLKDFDIKVVGSFRVNQPHTIKESSFSFFETKPAFDNMPKLLPSSPKSYIKLSSGNTEFYPLAVTSWGGYALMGSFIVQKGEYTLFTIEPIRFFRRVFGETPFIPDVTTENGRRILLVHIDGDAFFGNADFDPSKNLGEVLRDRIIKAYPVPHTFSIIEGEIAPHGLYPERASRLEDIARSIFALPNVEIASHTFSHPYKWQIIEAIGKGLRKEQYAPEGTYNLPIKNYRFDLRREIQGSIGYIDQNLAPKGKKTLVLLWSGDTNPSEEAIRLAYEASVYNVNGGYTWINRKDPFWMFISPMGVNKGEYFQVYAPILNENIYTNLWTDYYGFVRVIDTFKMTEEPYRLKPINIYYHTYSAQKISSLETLKKVYDWATSQKTNPQYISEYAQKVLEFRNYAFLENMVDGSLLIRGGGNMRTLRLDKKIHVDISKSKGVVGYMHHANRTYISLDSSGEYRVALSEAPSEFSLVSSNGAVKHFKHHGGVYRLKLVSHVPLELEIQAPQCEINLSPKADSVETLGTTLRIRYKERKDAELEARCKR